MLSGESEEIIKTLFLRSLEKILCLTFSIEQLYDIMVTAICF